MKLTSVVRTRTVTPARRSGNSQGRSVKDKAPVLGMVERSGKLVAKTVPGHLGEGDNLEIVKER